MLIEMLKVDPYFQTLPRDQQTVHAKLAQSFAGDTDSLFLSPKELLSRHGIGTEQNWQDFLNIETVQRYISAQMAFHTRVSQRKSLPAITKAAMNGDIQAAKMLENLSGVLNSGDRNKQIVMHYIPRPKDLRKKLARPAMQAE